MGEDINYDYDGPEITLYMNDTLLLMEVLLTLIQY